MTNLRNFVDRVVVIGTSIVTWLTAFVAILMLFSDELVSQLPDELAAQVSGWIGIALAVLGGVIVVIREVTRVLPEAVGLLPNNGVEWTTREVAALHRPPPPNTKI